MQLLTVATFALKGKIKSSFKKRGHEKITPKLVLTLWLVLFFSKFVFLGVLNFLFGENLEISGFIGLVIIIATATALQQLLEFSYRRLS